MKSLVSIIVVNHNGEKYLKPCFDSLFNVDKGNFSLEIVMVDNLSTDNSVNFVKKKFPEIKIIENDVNNYTKALNLGIKNSQGDYIAILNNDTIVEKRWLTGLIEVMRQNERIGVVQSKILFPDGETINSIGVEEIADFYFKDIAFGETDVGKYEEVQERKYFSGGSALLRRDCVESVGDFDEDFMFYVEDLDYSFRCYNKGWKIFYSPKSVVYHRFHGTASREFCEYFCSRNRLLVIGKHFPLRLPQSIETSHFCHRNEYENLYHSLIQATRKMVEHNDNETSKKVLNELKNVVIDVFGRDKANIFSDYRLLQKCKELNIQEIIAGHRRKQFYEIPVLGRLVKKLWSLEKWIP